MIIIVVATNHYHVPSTNYSDELPIVWIDSSSSSPTHPLIHDDVHQLIQIECNPTKQRQKYRAMMAD